MAKTLVAINQITPPATIANQQPLLTNVARLSALNPKELLALAVYFRATELAHDTSSPLTNYDPTASGATLKTNLTNLIQDAQALAGNIAKDDVMRASVAVDWQNAKTVYGSLASDVDTLASTAAVQVLRELSEDQLRRILLYLRLEIGE
jgi:hypothetical protein